MELKHLLSVLVVFLLIGILSFYWFIPVTQNQFVPKYNTPNFSVNEESEEMQFYSNMRFIGPEISYSIENCPVDRRQDMLGAFKILEEKTILKFKSDLINPDIEVLCEDKVIESEKGFFIAGEGGPTNVTLLETHSIIEKGKILLLKKSQCPTPNVALHELLHALGFVHSPNPQNIMYPISNCNQELSEDIINKINELYSIPSLPDLKLDKVSAKINNRYLDLNLTIMNNGFANSKDFKLIIFIDAKILREENLQGIDAGYGRALMFSNIFITSIKFDEIKLSIEYPYSELDKENNIVILE